MQAPVLATSRQRIWHQNGILYSHRAGLLLGRAMLLALLAEPVFACVLP